MTSYVLVVTAGCPGIRCLLCGKTSYHRMDIAQRYCGHCQVFHDDQAKLAQFFRQRSQDDQGHYPRQE
jgi:hypothetical protein